MELTFVRMSPGVEEAMQVTALSVHLLAPYFYILLSPYPPSRTPIRRHKNPLVSSRSGARSLHNRVKVRINYLFLFRKLSIRFSFHLMCPWDPSRGALKSGLFYNKFRLLRLQQQVQFVFKLTTWRQPTRNNLNFRTHQWYEFS